MCAAGRFARGRGLVDENDSSRRRAREVALQVLYAIDLGEGRGPLGAPAGEGVEATASSGPDKVFDAVSAHFEMPEAARAFALELVQAVQQRLETLDRTIAEHSANWRIDRMATVDRNILRLGTYELAHTTTPARVILNEAVDLARRFSGDPSPAFVNGILDAVARGVRECMP